MAAPAETMSQIKRSNRDALSKWHAQRKLHPGIEAQNGTSFPVEASNGKLHPGIDAQTGTHFPNKRLAENASRNEPSDWDALSETHPIGKLYPDLNANSGTQFPLEGCFGKRVPFRSHIPG